MLNIIRSNRLEILADVLATFVAIPGGNPLEKQDIIVQSSGMGHWLMLQLAAKNGICANIRTPFVASWVWELFESFLEDAPLRSYYDPDVLTWPILSYLEKLPEDAAHSPLFTWLKGADDAKYQALASRIANTYDKYLVYRPDMLLDWENGMGEDWQALLWRHLSQATPGKHRAILAQEFIRFVEEGRSGSWPQCVHVFGISSLPPVFIQLFKALSQRIEVYWFVLDPSREYWGGHFGSTHAIRSLSEGTGLHNGNPLLSSLGRQGREFLDFLLDANGTDTDVFVQSKAQTLLASLQNSILGDLGHLDGYTFEPSDDSIRLHICHSPMREIEVLHNALLDCVEHKGIGPADIVVMTPDIEIYAPYIEAVFGNAPTNHKFPYTIADKVPVGESRIIENFFWFLQLPQQRFEVEKVLALFETRAISDKFDLDRADCDQIERWLKSTHICWGLDARNRADLGLPGSDEHTWRFGIERLLLGFALPVDSLYASRLPFRDIEGHDAHRLGQLCSFIEKLSFWRQNLVQKRTVADWQQALHELLKTFFDGFGEEKHVIDQLHRAIDGFSESARIAGYDGEVSLALVREAMTTRLSVYETDGFMGGGVTFCSMVPMRAVPFKVVCLIGLNDGSYPRKDKAPDFDLTLKSRQMGDRSRRDDDRYLFLEAIVSAREQFYISYVGRDIRDNSIIPPSAIVSEFLDTLDQVCSTSKDVAKSITILHPLKGYSPLYFTGGNELYSYSETMCRACAGKYQESIAAPFFEALYPLPDSDFLEAEETPVIDLKMFSNFLRNPSRGFLKKRIGLDLGGNDEEINSREPFICQGLEAYKLKKLQLDASFSGQFPDDTLKIAHELGYLPHGVTGLYHYENKLNEVEKLLGSVGRCVEILPSIPVRHVSSSLILAGQLEPLTQSGLLLVQPSRWRASGLLHIWIHHLLLNLIKPNGIDRISRYVSENEIWYFTPLDDAELLLEDLIVAWHFGHSRLLPFFPEASFVFASILFEGQGLDAARNAARSRFKPKAYQQGPAEHDDPYVNLAWRGRDPLDEEFESWAIRIYEPLIACVSKIGGVNGNA